MSEAEGNFFPTNPSFKDPLPDPPKRKVIRRVLSNPGGKLLGSGVTSWVWLLKEDGNVSKKACKSDFDRNQKDLAWEASIYRRIGPHPRLIKLIDHTERGSLLEHMANGNLKEYLENNPAIDAEQRRLWAIQAAEGLDLVHRHGIFHCDCKPSNIFVGNDLELKIIDFSDSKLMDTTRGSNEGTRFYWPRRWKDPPTAATEAFALTCTIFQIMTGAAPFEELPSDEVTRLYQEKQHPSLTGVPYRAFFERGFAREFATPSEILDWFSMNP